MRTWGRWVAASLLSCALSGLLFFGLHVGFGALSGLLLGLAQ